MQPDRPRCPNELCPSQVDGEQNIIIHGRTKNGKIRYACKRCGRTFTHPRERKDDRGSFQQRYARWLRKNSYPVSEIAFMLGVSKRTIHRWLKETSKPKAG